MDLQLAGRDRPDRGGDRRLLGEPEDPAPRVRDGLRADAGHLAQWEETKVSTVAVVVASVVAGLILFCIDTMSYKLMVEWLPALWGKL